MNTLRLLFGFAFFLTACGPTTPDREATQALCKCQELQSSMADTKGILNVSEKLEEVINCYETWEKDYAKKVDPEKFGSMVKQHCPKAYDKAVEMNVVEQ